MCEIPPRLHSFEHDEPFKTCLTCEQKFTEIDHPYTITKVLQGTECVFEYAMCLPCRHSMMLSFSEESRQTMNDFFEQNPHVEARTEKLQGNQNFDDWIQNCATCDVPLSETKNYNLGCMAFDSELLFDPGPMMVCSTCEQKMQKSLSKSTRQEWDKFILDNFDGPPADALKPDGVPILV